MYFNIKIKFLRKVLFHFSFISVKVCKEKRCFAFFLKKFVVVAVVVDVAVVASVSHQEPK